MAEAGAKAAVAALKDATLIKSKKADWRLVAAAQVMLRGDHPDEFATAAAMGKPIKQRREVSNWLDKLRELERMRASLRSQPGSSGSAAGSSLLVQPGWIHEHAPGVKQLSVSAPVVPPGKQHDALAQRGCDDAARHEAPGQRDGRLHATTRGRAGERCEAARRPAPEARGARDQVNGLQRSSAGSCRGRG